MNTDTKDTDFTVQTYGPWQNTAGPDVQAVRWDGHNISEFRKLFPDHEVMKSTSVYLVIERPDGSTFIVSHDHFAYFMPPSRTDSKLVLQFRESYQLKRNAPK